ncbi:MAG: serine hydrolase [Blastocatellia bacterium]|nr:serine hydrolase [Blastocatellia bacterium]
MKFKTPFLVLTISVLTLTFGSSLGQKSGPTSDRIQRVENNLLPAIILKGRAEPMKIADRLAHYKVPGVSIAVINNGKLEWAKGYGVAEAGSARPVTVETRFQAASISKPVAALAALALVQQGQLNLDENVNLKLKSWQVPDNEFTKEQNVTLRRLVSHSAGLTVHGFRGYAADESVPTLVQILDGQKPANSAPIRVNLLPGSKWRYSGGGYNVLQQLLLDVTGKPFPTLMQELVLSKIGMKQSTYQQPLPKEWEAVGAIGHRADGQPVKGRWHTYPEMAAAGLWTTPSDLARFAIELQQSLKGKSNKVLSAEMTRQMLTRQIGEYGLGIGLGGKENITSFSHGGSNEGFRCMLFAYLDSGQGAIVMTNGDRGSNLTSEILRAIAREYGWPDYLPTEKTVIQGNPAQYSSYVGKYNAGGTLLTVSIEAGRLFLLAPPFGPQRVELFPSAENRFFVLEDGVEFSFVKDGQGEVGELQVIFGSNTQTAKKVK